MPVGNYEIALDFPFHLCPHMCAANVIAVSVLQLHTMPAQHHLLPPHQPNPTSQDTNSSRHYYLIFIYLIFQLKYYLIKAFLCDHEFNYSLNKTLS